MKSSFEKFVEIKCVVLRYIKYKVINTRGVQRRCPEKFEVKA